MDAVLSAEQCVDILRSAIVSLVRRDGPDLTARQLGVFLTCYLETEDQTVRGLAAKLAVAKPAISRALDRLSDFDLVRRKTDLQDRRCVLVRRTATGMVFMRQLRTILSEAKQASGHLHSADRRATGQSTAPDQMRPSLHFGTGSQKPGQGGRSVGHSLLVGRGAGHDRLRVNAGGDFGLIQVVGKLSVIQA
jgi:DNA-binding MarR family transcriptional regulator